MVSETLPSRTKPKDGWRTVRFGEVVRNVDVSEKDPLGKGLERIVGLEYIEPGSLHIREWGDLTDGTSFSRTFRAGQVLFGKRRAYQRKVAYAEFDGICSGDILVFEAVSKELLPGLLPFVVQSEPFFEHALQTSAGSLSPRTKWAELAKYEFALPPKDEQRRIAEILWAAERHAESLMALRLAREDLRRRLIVHLYRHGLDRHQLVESPLGSVPADWEIAPLGSRYEIQLGKMMSERARSGSGMRPYIRNENVQWNRLDLADVAMMNFSDREVEKFSLKVGDLLVCEGRHVGKTAVWRGEIEGACYQKALHRLRPRSNRDVPEFMLYCMQFFAWTGRFGQVTGETTIPHLPAARLRAMLFPFPPPREQEAIVKVIEDADLVGGAVDAAHNQARLLGRGLFSALMSVGNHSRVY